MKAPRAYVVLPLLTALCGCVGDPKVVRVYDGRVVEGEFVPAEAYAEYLKGVLADEAGDLPRAVSAYEQAAREDDTDPEPVTRVGDARCRLDPKDPAADRAIQRALDLDPTYAPALAAAARCAGLRGRPANGLATLGKIESADRTSVTIEALLVRLGADARGGDGRAGRERAMALTAMSGDRAASWDALVAWGRARGEGELLAAGLIGLLRVAPLRSREVEAGAVELLGSGRASLARRVAGAVADLSEEQGGRSIHDPTAARLAVDDAILTSDDDRISRRAARGHVPLAEVAARALLLERPAVATRLAETVAAADPASGGATMVLLALAGRRGELPAAAGEASALARLATSDRDRAPTDRPSAACALVFGERLAAAAGPEVARTWLTSVAPSAIAAHDSVVGPLAVDLAARGAIPESALPMELRLELAARRRESPPAVDAKGLATLDARHTLLVHALTDPAGAAARGLLAKLEPAADRDPIIGYALARAALASAPSAAGWASVTRALAAAPGHPLILAVAVDVAKRAGKAEDLPPARARLMAVARTPAERALATE